MDTHVYMYTLRHQFPLIDLDGAGLVILWSCLLMVKEGQLRVNYIAVAILLFDAPV